MRSCLKKYFTFNKRERNGIIVLLVVLFLLVISIQLLPFFVSPPKYDLSKMDLPVSNPINDSIQSTGNDRSMDDKTPIATVYKSELRIDPNTASENELLSIGLSKKVVRTLLKYRSKGGKFKTLSDIKKVYGMNDSVLNFISSVIRIEGDTNTVSSQKHAEVRKVFNSLEINSADSLSFVMLKGIGPSFAHRIILYRKKLGGFISLEQLQEVYGLDSLKLNEVKHQLSVDNSLINQMNINTLTAAELRKHAYINHNLANLIVAYRNTHGFYKSVQDVKKLNLVTEELYLKLAPYLTVEQK